MAVCFLKNKKSAINERRDPNWAQRGKMRLVRVFLFICCDFQFFLIFTSTSTYEDKKSKDYLLHLLLELRNNLMECS